MDLAENVQAMTLGRNNNENFTIRIKAHNS